MSTSTRNRSLANLKVSASSTKSILRCLEEKGVDRALIAGRCGIKLEKLDNADARISLKNYHKLWEEAVSLTGQKDIGLYLGKRANEKDMGLLGHIFFNNATLEHALLQYQRYYKIVNEGMHIKLDMDQRYVAIQYVCNVPEAYCIPDMERTLAVSVQRARDYISPQLKIEYVGFQHEEQGYSESYRKVFPCEVRFNEPYSCIVFQRRFLDFRLPNHSSYLHKILTRHVENLLKKITPKPRFTDRVKKAISSAMAKDCIDAENIADKLCMSRNTLYRKLKAENVSFHDLVDEVRQRKAMSYMKSGKHNLSEIAFLLGFSELSAFSRAFKRWTGDSPAKYLKKASAQTKSK